MKQLIIIYVGKAKDLKKENFIVYTNDKKYDKIKSNKYERI